LVEKTNRTSQEYQVKTVLMAGGVAANSLLRNSLTKRAAEEQLKVAFPSLSLCTDNAAMIAGQAYMQYKCGDFASLELNAYPGLLSL